MKGLGQHRMIDAINQAEPKTVSRQQYVQKTMPITRKMRMELDQKALKEIITQNECIRKREAEKLQKYYDTRTDLVFPSAESTGTNNRYWAEKSSEKILKKVLGDDVFKRKDGVLTPLKDNNLIIDLTSKNDHSTIKSTASQDIGPINLRDSDGINASTEAISAFNEEELQKIAKEESLLKLKDKIKLLTKSYTSATMKLDELYQKKELSNEEKAELEKLNHEISDIGVNIQRLVYERGLLEDDNLEPIELTSVAGTEEGDVADITDQLEEQQEQEEQVEVEEEQEIIELTDEIIPEKSETVTTEDMLRTYLPDSFVSELKFAEGVISDAEEKELSKEYTETIAAEAETLSKEPEAKREMKDEMTDIAKMPDKKKKNWLEGIGNLGYRVSEWKNRTMGSVVEKISDLAGRDTAVGKYFKNYAKNTYFKSARKDRMRLDTLGKGYISSGSGALKGVATFMKWGRVAYDLFGHGSLKAINPFRHFTAIAMFVGSNAEALKDTRLENKDVIANTRIGNADDFQLLDMIDEGLIDENDLSMDQKAQLEKARTDYGRAYEEAWKIHERAEKKGEGKQPTKDQLLESYQENIPQDIQERFRRGDFVSQTKWYKFYIGKSKSVKYYADKLSNKLAKIDDDSNLTKAQREKKKKVLLAKSADLINDLDRMVGDAGTIDAVAAYSWIAEKTGKGVATALIFDSLRMMLEGAWNLRSIFNVHASSLDDTENTPVQAHVTAALADSVIKSQGAVNPGMSYNSGDVEKFFDTEKITTIDSLASEQRVATLVPVAKDLAESNSQQIFSENQIPDSGISDAIHQAEDSKQIELPKTTRGFSGPAKLILGKDGIPDRLFRVMQEIAMDGLEKEEIEDGIVLRKGNMLLNEDVAARNENVAANLTLLAEQPNTGIKGMEMTPQMRSSFIFDRDTKQLEIKDNAEFNKLVNCLHEHAKQLPTEDRNRIKDYLHRISYEGAREIIHSKGLEKFGIAGHDEVVGFDHSGDNPAIKKVAESVVPREAKTELLTEKEIPVDMAELEKNEAIKQFLDGRSENKSEYASFLSTHLAEYKEEIGDIILKIPEDIREFDDQCLNYLKIFMGNAEEKADGLKQMFALQNDLPPKSEFQYGFQFDEDKNAITLCHAYRNHDIDVQIDLNKNELKVAVDGSEKWWQENGVKNFKNKLSMDSIKAVEHLFRDGKTSDNGPSLE